MSAASTEGPVSRYINRRVSRPLARLVAPTPITPNQVSVVALLLAAGAFVCLAIDQPIAAGVLIQISSIVDGADGDLARLQHRQTPFGAVFDAALDRYADALIVGGMTWWAWSHAGEPAERVIVVGIATLTGFLLTSYSRARLEVEGYGSLLSGVMLLAGRDVRLLAAAVGAAVGQAYWTLVILGAVTYAVLALRLLAASRAPVPQR
jgi:phosphatidylglycerophosphate synthase